MFLYTINNPTIFRFQYENGDADAAIAAIDNAQQQQQQPTNQCCCDTNATAADCIDTRAVDMAKLQRECPELDEYIKYIETGELPDDDKVARKIAMTADA